MTEHLPECPMANNCVHDYYHEPPIQCADCGESCICDRLRRCEQRVEEAMDRSWTQTVALAVAHTRTSTLDAAREAVAALSAQYKVRGNHETYGAYHEGRSDMQDLALSAIDALKMSE